jgi:dTDP-4-amino-4,6-dideoxygalactose transaminase
MKQRGITCVFHYVPLHSSPYGRVSGRVSGNCEVTKDIANRLVRIPLWVGVEQVQTQIITAIYEFFDKVAS